MKYFILLSLLSTGAFAAESKFTHESQAGVVVTGGNSHTQNIDLRSQTRYEFVPNAFQLNGNYLRASNNGTLSSLVWLVGVRYERAFTDMLSGFLGQSVEGDNFAGILQRYNSDLGAKYYFYKLDKDLTWFGEAGYRYTREHASNGTTNGYQKARLYSETEKFWSPNTSTKLWLEYIPNFTLSAAWLFNGELSMSSALNSVFAIKSAIQLRYNHAPPSKNAQKADTLFSTALVAKF